MPPSKEMVNKIVETKTTNGTEFYVGCTAETTC
jgi:hypothetical protein